MKKFNQRLDRNPLNEDRPVDDCDSSGDKHLWMLTILSNETTSDFAKFNFKYYQILVTFKYLIWQEIKHDHNLF